jgi:lactoylglutathione lyase
MVKWYEHVAINTMDIDRSVKFYERVGGSLVREGVIPSSGTRLAYLQFGEGIIEILSTTDPARVGINHIAFQTDDLDSTYQSIEKAGRSFSVKPKTAGSGVGRVAFFDDPDGLRVELLEQPNFRKPLRDMKPDRLFIDIDHISLVVSDLAASQSFYAGNCKAKETKRFDLSNRGMLLCYCDVGYGVLGLKEFLGEKKATEKCRYGHIAVRVKSVDETVRMLRAEGVTVAGEPRDAATGLGRIGVLLDPDGIRLELADRDDYRKM